MNTSNLDDSTLEPSDLDHDLQFEQVTTSPHVLQFTTDYLFVRQTLLAKDAPLTIDAGMGDADMALSIVNDAYAHNNHKELVEAMPQGIPWEQAKRELGIDDNP